MEATVPTLAGSKQLDHLIESLWSDETKRLLRKIALSSHGHSSSDFIAALCIALGGYGGWDLDTSGILPPPWIDGFNLAILYFRGTPESVAPRHKKSVTDTFLFVSGLLAGLAVIVAANEQEQEEDYTEQRSDTLPVTPPHEVG
jgi:hypothetical protein